MLNPISPRTLAGASARRPWVAVTAWAVIAVISVVLAGLLLPGALTTTADTTTDPESRRGRDLLEDRLRGPQQANEAVIVQSDRLTVDDPAFRAEVESLHAALQALGPGVIDRSTTYYESGDPLLVSGDRRATLIPVTMAGDLDHAEDNISSVLDVVDQTNGADGFEVFISGNASISHDFSTAAEEDLMRGEMIGGAIALLILVLVLGAVVAAVVPLLMAIASIAAALGVTALIGQGFELSFFITNMITMMGLAVGIDYSLFVLSRFREERQRGRPLVEAIDVASSTAGRAVFFSGLTVIIALLGMLILPSTIFRSIGTGAILVVSFAILASLTLLPALMRLLGDRVNSLRVPFLRQSEAGAEGASGGFWDRVAVTVMRHPAIGVVVVTAALVALAVPYLGIRTGSAGVSTLPDSFQSKQGFLILAEQFDGGQVSPAEVVIDGDAGSPAVLAAVERLQDRLATDPVFGPTSYTTNDAGDLGLLTVQVVVDPTLEEANDGIRRLREDYIPSAFERVPAEVLVTGQTATNVDGLAIVSDYTPIVFAFVLGLSFVLLMLVFRSIVVPAKAIVMNLLSVGAAYGLLVLVFQEGYGAGLLGFQKVETVEFWLPLFLFSVLFGLSMDYHVFLLSRIRERFDQSGNNTEAVAFGLRSTGRLITGAALIMVAVFGGFAMGDLVMLQQVGFGLGVAVFIDATVIRSVLVPASMRLLGKWNWYLPDALGWLPHLGIEGGPDSVRREALSGSADPAGGSGA